MGRPLATVGLVAGPLLAAALLAVDLPPGMSEAARRTGAVTALMACWWITEAVPIAVTALLPIVLFPLLGVLSTRETAAPYADTTNLFFLGGLTIAAGVERWGLQRRLALHMMARLGSSPRRIVLGFTVATAAISMWTSNAATTMMMLPLAVAVLEHFEGQGLETHRHLGPALMLTVAYAASIGGIGTPVGTPPNLILIGALHRLFPDAPPLGFAGWTAMATPMVVVLVPLTWLYLTRVAFRVPATAPGGDLGVVRTQLQALGPMSRPERRMLAVFATTAGLWFLRGDVDIGIATLPGWSRLLPASAAADDTTVAIAMAILLFILPSGDGGSRLLGGDWVTRIPWGVLVLLGGGFALAAGVESSGLAAWLAEHLRSIGGMPPILLVLTVAALLTVLTEFTVNTAIAALMMPILAATALGLDVDPRLLMVPATISASLGFMMPGGTAPNAMVFASGRLTVPQMVRAGFGLDLLAILTVTVLFYLIGMPVLGITPGATPPWAR